MQIFLIDEYRKKFTIVIDNHKSVLDEQTVQELIVSLQEEKLLLQSDFTKYKILFHGDIKYKINEPKLQLELKRMVSNIINNSIEAFRDDSGVIDLMLSENSDTLSIQIKDNGKGIPSHLLETAFERGATFNKPRGTGLGLFHAKDTVEKFGGKIDLSSKENF